MGIQYACAKQVNRIGVVTTMITGTLASLVFRIVHRIELPMSYDPKNPDVNIDPPWDTLKIICGILSKRPFFLSQFVEGISQGPSYYYIDNIIDVSIQLSEFIR